MKHNTNFITLPVTTQDVTPICTDNYTLKPMPLRIHTVNTPRARRTHRQNKIKIVVAVLFALLTVKLATCFHFVVGRVTWLDSANNIIAVTASDGSIYEFKADTDTYTLHAPITLVMFDNNTLDDITDDIVIGDTH